MQFTTACGITTFSRAVLKQLARPFLVAAVDITRTVKIVGMTTHFSAETSFSLQSQKPDELSEYQVCAEKRVS